MTELRREERICKQCTNEEVEDEVHFVLQCEALSEERRNYMNLVDGWQYGGERDRLMLILERACNDDGVGRELEKMWRSQFLRS